MTLGSDSILKPEFTYRDYFAPMHPADIELELIRHGGELSDGGFRMGNGLFYHMKRFQQIVWPDKGWHRWNNLILGEVGQNRITGMLGPANSGKTHESACVGLTLFWARPESTTILVSSTDSRSLELRIWGEMKKYIGLAQEVWDPPGRMIASRQMYVAPSNIDDEDDIKPEDFRNGVVGIPCMQGNTFVGLGKYVGVKNDVIMLIADEASLMGKSFFDAISNLNKNRGFKGIVMGNPKDPTDCLGLICEPHPSLGGWEGIEQGVKTQTWQCRRRGTRCIQLVGTDSPNFDVPEGQPEPYPYLIGREEIAADLEYYGEDNLHFQMMDLGVMPKNAQSRRVITRLLCEQNKTSESAVWKGTKIKELLGIDAAYSSVGGDRTIGIHAQIGLGQDDLWLFQFVQTPLTIPTNGPGTPEETIVAWTQKYCEDHGIPAGHVFFDGTGRASLMNAFAKNWSAEVCPIEFGGKPTSRFVSDSIRKPAIQHYGKFVSELWFAVRHVIEAGQMKQMASSAIDEGCMREWGIVGKGKVDVEPKDMTKKRLGRSPDIFDALAACLEGARRLGFQIGRLANKRSYRSFEEAMNHLRMQQLALNSRNSLQSQSRQLIRSH